MHEKMEGIARTFDKMETSHLHGPALDVDAGGFPVTLRNEPIFTGVDPEWRATANRLPVSLAQKRLLLAHPDGFTNEDYRRLNAVDRDEACRQIQELMARGLVLSPGTPGSGAIYRVVREVAAQAAGRNVRNVNAEKAVPGAHSGKTPARITERVAALRGHLAEHGSLKNAGYRRMFDLERYAAVRELRRLTTDGYLRMEGKGQATRYAPGPALGGRKCVPPRR